MDFGDILASKINEKSIKKNIAKSERFFDRFLDNLFIDFLGKVAAR